MLYVLVVGKIYLLREEETLLHANTEISYTFDLFSIRSITNGKLRQPNAVYKSLMILHDIVKDQIQKDEKFHPHKFVMLSLHYKHLDLGVLGVQNINILLRIDRGTQNQYL
jgi:hypothetical protein